MKTPHLTPLWLFFALTFLCFDVSLNAQGVTYKNGKVNVTELPDLVGNKKKAPFWRVYMYEYGDGNYTYKVAKDENVKLGPLNYSYGNKSQDRNLKVHLTPVYSTTKSKTLKTKVSRNSIVTGKNKISYNVIKKGKNVGIFSNSFWSEKYDTDPKIVPGHEVQVVVHYNIPQNSSGYLALFYDDELIEEISGGDIRSYYSERKLNLDYFSKTPSALNSNAKSTYSQLEKEYSSSCILFEANNQESSKEQRLFLTMKLRDDLSEDMIDENEEIELKAIWVPRTGEFSEKKNVTSYKMNIVSYHDPNRIRVKPRKEFYRKNFPIDLKYKVSFENIGEGVVEDIRIEVTLPENVDVNTFKLNRTNPKGLPMCPANFQKTENSQCLQVEKISLAEASDTLVLTIYNSGLLGTEEKKKYRKGFIEFTVSTNKTRSKKSFASADIIFGNNKPIQTFPTRTKWRMQSIQLKTGINLLSDVVNFDFSNIDVLDVLSGGLVYQNAPLGTGFTHTIDLSLTGSRFTGDSSYVVQPSGLVPSGGTLSLSQIADVKFLEAQYKLGYQVNGIFRVFGGGGVSSVALGELQIDADVSVLNSDNIEVPVIQTSDVANFGLFEEKDIPTVFNQTIDPVTGMGFIGSLGIEVGWMNEFTFGVSNQFRYYPKFYHEGCQYSNNWNAYLRFRLFNVGGRK